MHAKAPGGLALIESLQEANLEQRPKIFGQAIPLESLHKEIQLGLFLHSL